VGGIRRACSAIAVLAAPLARLRPLATRQSKGTVSSTLAPSRVRNPGLMAGETLIEQILGGVGGIRTLETGLNRLHDFQSCSFSQLGHHSAGPVRPRARRDYSLAEGGLPPHDQGPD
jgi:hypothetical protein